jgi:hypothetical protein
MLLNHRQQSASNFRVEVKASQPPFADHQELARSLFTSGSIRPDQGALPSHCRYPSLGIFW